MVLILNIFILALSLTFVSAKGKTAELLAVAQLFRHGQRTPNSFYATDPYSDFSYWNLSNGQLTNEGKRQHYNLGQFTRQRYSDLLPLRYSNDDFYAQTTNVDRTHMSGQSNIAGLYPPVEEEIWNEDVLWQPIPLHTADTHVISTVPNCAGYFLDMAHALANDDYYLNVNKNYSDVYEYLSLHSGENVTTVTDVNSIYDTLIIEEQFGYQLPEWTSSVYPEPMRTIAGYAFEVSSHTTHMKRLTAGSLLNTILSDFEAMAANSSSSYKYKMYSAHDSNVAAVLNTLGAYDPPFCPVFASTIYFELWSKGRSEYVNIYYKSNDVVEPITVKGCDFSCTLADMRQVLSDYLINSNTYDVECALNSSSLTNSTTIDESVHDPVKKHIWNRLPKINKKISSIFCSVFNCD